MRYLVVFLVALSALATSAQLTPQAHSVRLFSGEQFTGEKLAYRSPILKSSFFDLDGVSYTTNEVAFFQNNHGYFANLCKLHGDNAERYAIRIRTGRIQLFEEIEITAYAETDLQTEGTVNEMIASGEDFQYYTMGEGAVKRATYRNLKTDLANNPASMKELRVFRNYRYLQIGLIGLGAGLITWDILRQSDDDVRLSAPIAIGIVLGGSSYFLEGSKDNARWLAVDAYNR